MLLYSVIMFLTAAFFVGVGIAICNGKTNLIHDYHRTKVTDQKAYGRAFGKAMFVVAAALLLSGILSLFGESMVFAAVAVLFLGLGIGVGCIVAVQRKYNKGVF